MDNTVIVTGTLTDDRTVTLDEAIRMPSARVRLVVKPLSPCGERPYLEVVEEIRQRQAARGHRPPTKEQIDSYLNAERDSWER